MTGTSHREVFWRDTLVVPGDAKRGIPASEADLTSRSLRKMLYSGTPIVPV
ncbi:hypothetical protein THTE_2125 [Thermogutta terrifontis]|uniref:Uncharacterized protein n=1 Tax=Thermogutta terrifontis TaxID=1331910 RepID=A0A286RFK3_9BACT|nr:hypothetical protein THTE_2125 [Thermogutta terrifontis]